MAQVTPKPAAAPTAKQLERLVPNINNLQCVVEKMAYEIDKAFYDACVAYINRIKAGTVKPIDAAATTSIADFQADDYATVKAEVDTAKAKEGEGI